MKAIRVNHDKGRKEPYRVDEVNFVLLCLLVRLGQGDDLLSLGLGHICVCVLGRVKGGGGTRVEGGWSEGEEEEGVALSKTLASSWRRPKVPFPPFI